MPPRLYFPNFHTPITILSYLQKTPMSPSQNQNMSDQQQQQPITYSHIFSVHGQLASQPIAPQDAATLLEAESAVLGENPKTGLASSPMQSAADINLQCHAVSPDRMTAAVERHGATVSEAEIDGYRVITEAIGGQVIGQYGIPTETVKKPQHLDPDAVTNKPVDEKDAAAIQAAEARATGLGHSVPGGIGEEAQSAAAYNLKTSKLDDKRQLADILIDATDKLVKDKAVTREDAEGIIAAEIRSAPDMATNPGGVSASIAVAARLNQQK